MREYQMQPDKESWVSAEYVGGADLLRYKVVEAEHLTGCRYR